MNANMLAAENNDFEINGQLEFIQGKGGFVYAHIANSHAEALVCTYSGQVLSYRPLQEEEDMLFVSEAAYFEPGKAIKGGIPICWPWFGPDPEGRGRPAHGFVRNRQWQVIDSEALRNGETRLILGIDSSEETRDIWPESFELRIEINVGRSLDMALITTNRSTHAIALTQALHSYFRVGDISQVELFGLNQHQYIDKLDGDAFKPEPDIVRIDREVDRIYTDVRGDLIIDDDSLKRSIRIQSVGSESVVVWNPWIDKAAAMGDFGSREYQQMLCVETANAGPDVVTIAPGEEYRLGVRYSVEYD